MPRNKADYEGFRDYPVRVKLTSEEEIALNKMTDNENSKSEILRKALGFALDNPELLDQFVQERQLRPGETILRYDGRNNINLLDSLVNKNLRKLRCSVMFVLADCKVYCRKGVDGITVENGKLDMKINIRSLASTINTRLLQFNISICADSITRVAAVNSLTGQEARYIPMRLESLSELEYLEIDTR